MINHKQSLQLFIPIILLIVGSLCKAQNNNPINFNNNWLFTESDSAKYALTTYNPSNWRMLDLPHDWSIEHNFSKELEGSLLLCQAA